MSETDASRLEFIKYGRTFLIRLVFRRHGSYQNTAPFSIAGSL
jgi:hypothetical protein